MGTWLPLSCRVQGTIITIRCWINVGSRRRRRPTALPPRASCHARLGEIAEYGIFPTDAHLELFPNGTMAGGTSNGEVRVYDRRGEQVGPTLIGHAGRILDIAVGNQVMATVSRDRTVRLWDLSTQRALGAPIPTESPVVDLSPDGRWLVTAEPEGTRLRDLDAASLVDAACAIAGRNLTVDEWERHLPANEPFRPTCAQWPNASA